MRPLLTGPSPQSNIVPLLAHDHDVLRHQLAGLQDTAPPERADRVERLAGTLTRHERAEKVAIHSAIRGDVLPGPEVTKALLAQEAEIKQRLATVLRQSGTESSFGAELSRFQSLVLEHLKEEEQVLVPLLSDLEADSRRWELGSRYLEATRVGASRPHIGNPHLPGRLLHRFIPRPRPPLA